MALQRVLSSFQPENYRLETKYENHLIVKVALVCIQTAQLLDCKL